jgi:hypothetical protein
MENITEKKIKIARTKSGSPCLWESYAEFDDLKRAIIIVDKDGKIKNSIFVRQSGSKQSLIPVVEGDFLVKVFADKQGNSVSLLEIRKIANDSNLAELMLIYRNANDAITGKLDPKFANAVVAAEKKMSDTTYIVATLFEKTIA